MVIGKVKEVFPGGNTPQGFVSFFDYIIPADTCRIMILKGGPGVGKSTFMKKIANRMMEKGYDVEFHHCSSDDDSLDAVVFPKIGVALLDGTSPHIVDPKHPGAVDEIIHLGDYWDETGIRKHKDEIISINQKIGKMFQRAYRFLRAAKSIHDDLEITVGEGLDIGLANQRAATLIETLFNGCLIGERIGFCRKLFGSAITPTGFVHHLETVFAPYQHIWMVTGEAGTGKATLIAKLAQAAVERGMNCEAYYCPFDPDKMEHLVIPELNIAVTTGVDPHRVDLDDRKVTMIDMNQCLRPGHWQKVQAVIAEDRQFIDELTKRAIHCLAETKREHDRLEQYYIPYMDFQAISALGEGILARVLKDAECSS